MVMVMVVKMIFFRINIFREKRKFVTNDYWKKIISGAYTNFSSFIPEIYKAGLTKSWLFLCFSLCSDFAKFYHEINISKVFCIEIVNDVTSLTIV